MMERVANTKQPEIGTFDESSFCRVIVKTTLEL